MASKETKQTPQAPAKAATPKYSAAELAQAAQKVFGVPQDVATAALRMAGVKNATIEEAQKIVGDFAKKEVN